MKRSPVIRQYTIRGVTSDLDRALRRRAREEGRSLNQLVLDLLRQGIELPQPPPGKHPLDRFIGTWVEDPEFDKAIAEMDQVDEEEWR